MAIILRVIQQFQAAKKMEFIALERKFAALEQRGVLPKGERMMPLASRDPGNTLIWQGRFPDLCSAQACLHQFETSPEHAELLDEQVKFFGLTWVEFYEVLDC